MEGLYGRSTENPPSKTVKYAIFLIVDISAIKGFKKVEMLPPLGLDTIQSQPTALFVE